jgi:hypothetical protein
MASRIAELWNMLRDYAPNLERGSRRWGKAHCMLFLYCPEEVVVNLTGPNQGEMLHESLKPA